MRLATVRMACLGALLAGAAAELRAAVDLGEMAALRAADRHAAAADLGLKGVLEQPWDHSLRYLVADSLERAGRFDEAAAQFSALQGTPLQGAAQGRLAALAGRTPQAPVVAPATRVAAAPPPAPATRVTAAPAPAPTLPPPRPVVPAPTTSTAPAVVATQSAPPATTARVGTLTSTAATAPRALASSATASAQPRRLGAPATLAPPATATAMVAAPAAGQPRRLGAPATLAPPATATASAAPAPSQPRRLGAPATLAPPSTATATAAAPAAGQPRRLGAPATLAPPATARSSATAAAPTSGQPRRLGAPATLAPPATASAQPRRLGAPATASSPTPSAPRAAARPTPRPSATPAQRIDALYAKGDYAEAGTQGLTLLEQGPIDPDLHLKIANSLAWSGKLRAGQAQYRALFDSKVDRDARLGLANTQRWNARFDLAMAGYQAVLDRNPDDSDALEGMKQSRLALAPRTTFGVEYTTDINPVERRGAMLGHRWHNEAGDTRYELKLVRYDDSIDWLPLSFGQAKRLPLPSNAQVDRQSLSVSIEKLAHPLQPQLTLTSQQKPDDNVIFGSGRIKLYEWPVWFRAGRLDWSHEALAPRAAIFGLVARHSGLEALGEFDWGQLYGQVDYYGITDGNSISAAQLRWTPSWRPLGARWRPLLGLEFRQAMRPAAEYWSPSLGHGSAYAGLSGDWSAGRWDLYGSAQYGVPLLEESGTSWSLSLGGRYRIADDLALSFGFWRMSSFRDNAAYRARAANLQVEKVWR